MTWGQYKITELNMWVSVGKFAGGENINPFMLCMVDLLLRNYGGRGRKHNYAVIVVAWSAPNTDGVWWWVTTESLVKSQWKYLLCVMYVASDTSQGPRGASQGQVFYQESHAFEKQETKSSYKAVILGSN